ncbi:MAG: phosphoribosylamine--glycine ligase [Thioalkalivibrionaceae bacterium]
MKLLVIGNGGREHAMAWKLAQSSRVDRVFVAPGNAGTAGEPKCTNVAIAATDVDALLEFARSENIALTVVGPEAPLVAGVVDRFRAAGLKIFGPTAACAELEGSKAFAKAFMNEHGIPTAFHQTFTDIEPALAFVRRHGAPIVVKADGLAAGKGVIVAETLHEAEAAVRDMLEGNAFGDAGHRVVIEEFLAGEEASFICMLDGKHVLVLASSQDHKRRDAADTGPNTGGMGAYSPAPILDEALQGKLLESVIEPVAAGMRARGTPYTGFLYAGIMVTADGTPKVLEFNCRFGDPETQPILARLESDFVDLLEAGVSGHLDLVDANWSSKVALGVVIAAEGYPENPKKGAAIGGLDCAASRPGQVFHAGTRSRDDHVIVDGGRVLCCVGHGDSVAEAQTAAHALVDCIHFEGSFHRRDIGHRAIAREHGGA